MPLALTVSLLVVGAIVLVAVTGYVIDKTSGEP
jgi:hypothetical protein